MQRQINAFLHYYTLNTKGPIYLAVHSISYLQHTCNGNLSQTTTNTIISVPATQGPRS